MSYDPLKDPANSPPNYPYPPQAPDGYQAGAFTPAVGSTNAFPQDNLPDTNATCGQRAQERDEKLREEEEYVPASIPVAHLNLDFKECFHEHESTKTIPALYNAMGFTYKYTKLFTYHFFVILFGFLFALFFALVNGIISFIHVWIYGPTLKITLLWVYALTPLVTVPLRAIFTPMVDVGARIFRQIQVKANLTGPLPQHFAGERSN